MQVLYIVGITAAFIAALLKNKKLSLFSAVCLFLLLTSVRTGNDITNYLNAYNRIDFDYKLNIMNEVFYACSELAIKSFGFNFYWFKAILTFFAFILLYHFIKHYTDNFGFVLLHYYIFFVFVDCQQFRNFLALAILLVAIDSFIRYHSKIKFIFFNFLAFGFHTAFAFYFSFLLLFQKISKKMVKVLAVCMIVFIALCIYNRDWLEILERLQSVFLDSRGRISTYFNLRTRWGFLPVAILHFCEIYLFIREKNILKNQWVINGKANIWEFKNGILKRVKKEDMVYRMVDFTFYANLLVIVCIPLSMLSLVFYRYIRNMYFINLISFAIISSSLKNHKMEKKFFDVAVLVISLIWLIYDAVFYYGTEETFDIIFNGVLFWK